MPTHSPSSIDRRRGATPTPRSPAARVAADGEPRLGFASPAERRVVVDWLNEGLRSGQPGRLVNEYPLLFWGERPFVPVTIWSGATPLAHCVLWPARFRVGPGVLHVGMISLVYTDPSVRGRGLAHRVVRRACAEADRRGLGLTILWSDADRLYRSLGFVHAGCESVVALDQASLDRAIGALGGPDPNLAVDAARPGDWPAIEGLRRERATGLELSPGELALARGIPDLDVRVVRGESGSLRAFAMRGRGDDFRQVVHEWGGDPRALLACCRSWLHASQDSDPTYLLGPVGERSLGWTLRRHGAASARRPMAWMRLAAVERFALDVSHLLARPISLERDATGRAEDASTRATSERLLVRSDLGRCRVEASELLRALFGSGEVSARFEGEARLGAALGPEVVGAHPIPFYVWGLESI